MADKGSGLSVTFDTNFLAAITSLTHTGLARAATETTTFATTGGRTYEPGEIYEPGELQCELLFDPDDPPSLQALSAAETVTVTYTNSGATTWAANGFMTGFEITAGDADDRVRASCTIKLSGNITITP